MKTLFRKLTALLTACSLAASLALPAAASDALGQDLTAKDTLLNQQTQLSTNVFWSESSANFRTENLVTYEPNERVTPIVTYGAVVTEKSTVSAAAQQLEAQGKRVVAAVNGDFYVVSSGVPVGLVITDGLLRSSDGGFHAIGFRADGTALLGKPGLTVDARFAYTMEDGTPMEIHCRPVSVNKDRNNTGVFLYTYDFNAAHTTGTTQPGVDVVCTILEGSLSIGGALTAAVDYVAEAGTATSIGENQLVFSTNLNADAALLDQMRSIPAGAVLTLSVQAPGWEDVMYAVGGLYSLVENGMEVPGLDAASAPRTAVGQRPDGTVIFYTIDGRRSGYSIGASMSQVARRMIELGCVTALCLDGGGSTTISVTAPDQTQAKLINRPSDGAERAVSNHILLVADAQPSGQLDHFYVSADSQYVLAGSRVNLSAAAIDTNFIPMAEQSYRLSTDGGQLEGNTLTTPAGGGTVTVTAEQGGRSGSTEIYAVSTPDGVAIQDASGTAITSLSAAIGSVTTLTASATYQHRLLKSDPEAFTWSVDQALGSFDQNGVFTASGEGSGTITVTAGGRSASIPVTVAPPTPVLPEDGGQTALLESFEGTTTIFRGGGKGLEYSLNSASDTVRLGRSSGKIDYELTESGGYSAQWRAVKPSAPAVASPYTSVALWLYGDGSGNEFSLLFGDGLGREAVQSVTALDFTGWRQVTVPIPFDGAQPQGFQIAAAGLGQENWTPAESKGTVYMDHILALTGEPDNEPPVVTAVIDETGTGIRASILDNSGTAIPAEAVSVVYNGQILGRESYTYDPSSGTVSFVLPSLGDAHEAIRVTVTAKDTSGNIGRASMDIPAYNVDHKFTDTADYWAADYCDFLYNAGITTGYSDGSFRPNDNVSRAQFAAMLYRYLGLKDSDYAGVLLPFADNNQIPSYAVAAVRGLYAEGVINGTEGKDGKLYFNSGASLSRAQAAAMIGRTQEKGYAAADLTFSDAESIPAYAAFYIRTMAAQGVISGYADGAFRPHNPITRGQMAKILYTLM